MTASILLTGADGVVGSEVLRLLADSGRHVVAVSRRGEDGPGRVRWEIGRTPPPDALRRRWDVIVHAAASTRWTMSREQAWAANIGPTAAVLDLAGPATHVVHVSTAYVGGSRDTSVAGSDTGGFGADGSDTDGFGADGFDGFRNGYEWSKARCEELVTRRHGERLTVVRPPLILGRRADGAIGRFSGPYTLLQSLVSGLAAVVVGDPAGYAEIAPVDEVAAAIAAAALTEDVPAGRRLEVVAAGAGSLRLADLLTIACSTLNDWRDGRGLPPIAAPPIVPTSRWRRFFLPLARQELSEVQNHAVDLLAMFESYTSMREPFAPTRPVGDPAAILARSVTWWADAKPRLAGRLPRPWALVPLGGGSAR